MFKFLTSTPVFFDGDDGGGAPAADSSWKADASAALAAADAADEAGQTVAPPADAGVVEPAAAVPAPDAPVTGLEDIAPETPAEPEVGTPDYGALVAGWGGEEAVKNALALDQALATREGAQALIEEAGKALYGLDPAKSALLQQLLADPAAPAAADPLAELLADPDALLTPAQAVQIADARVEAAVAKVLERITPVEERQAADARAAVERSVQSACADLKVPEAAQQRVLDLADKYITGPADLQNPTAVKNAIQRGQADWEAEMAAQQKAYLEAKKVVADETPTPLVSGTAPGGTEPSEPQTLKEAKARVRAALPDEFATR